MVGRRYKSGVHPSGASEKTFEALLLEFEDSLWYSVLLSSSWLKILDNDHTHLADVAFGKALKSSPSNVFSELENVFDMLS